MINIQTNLSLNQPTGLRHDRSIMTLHAGFFTLQNKRCKFNMAAIAVGLPPTGLIVCLGEFLRWMGNVSNIYRRVLASSDIHCINLTWPPLRQKAGLWEARFPECSLRETEVRVGIWNSGYKREERATVLPFDLCWFAFSRKSGHSVYRWVLLCVCVQPLACDHNCLCMCVLMQLLARMHFFCECECVCVQRHCMRVCFCLKLRLLFVEWSSGAHSDRWCKLLIAVFPVAECGGPCPPSPSSAPSLCLSPFIPFSFFLWFSSFSQTSFLRPSDFSLFHFYPSTWAQTGIVQEK